MGIVQEAQATAVLINEQGIPNTYQFSDGSDGTKLFDHLKDIEIEVPVQNLVTSVRVTVSGRIRKLNGEYQRIEDTHQIDFDLYNG
jgi:hypothetical protein